MTEVLNPKTNRFVKVGSQGYKRLVREGTIKAVEHVETPIKSKAILTPTQETEESDEETFDESKLQTKLAEISTDMISKNLKKIVKSQKLSDNEMDLLLKKMLYTKLCLEPPKPTKEKKTKKKTKFKLVEPSSSESD